MILLQEQKVLFLKARKVAGTSFEIALSAFAGEDDIITPITPNDEKLRREISGRGAQNYKYRISDLFFQGGAFCKALETGALPIKFFNHISAKEVKSKLGALWDECYKISIIRNPYDYLVSLYAWETKVQGLNIEFEEFVRNNPQYITWNQDQYFIDGVNIIDLYLRYEYLESDIRDLESKIKCLEGLWDCFSKIRAKANIRPDQWTVEELFGPNPHLASLVEFFCKWQLEFLESKRDSDR